MYYPHSRFTILGPKRENFLISHKFHSPDLVYSLIGFGGLDIMVSEQWMVSRGKICRNNRTCMRIPLVSRLVSLSYL